MNTLRRLPHALLYIGRGAVTSVIGNLSLAALALEPGDSKAHIHNAMTAAAHAAPVTWATRWADTDAEEQASQLLYQNVSWLPEPVEAE